jgi:hypothetical protein
MLPLIASFPPDTPMNASSGARNPLPRMWGVCFPLDCNETDVFVLSKYTFDTAVKGAAAKVPQLKVIPQSGQ